MREAKGVIIMRHGVILNMGSARCRVAEAGRRFYTLAANGGDSN